MELTNAFFLGFRYIHQIGIKVVWKKSLLEEMMISLHRCLKPAWQDASSNLLKSSIMHVRLLSSHPRPKSEPSDESLAEISGGWWRRVKTAMFPVSTMAETKAATEASSKQQKAMALMSPASLERLRRVKEAEERQQNLEASSGDVFTPLSKGAEEFSGNLFKAGMFMISLPLAGKSNPFVYKSSLT